MGDDPGSIIARDKDSGQKEGRTVQRLESPFQKRIRLLDCHFLRCAKRLGSHSVAGSISASSSFKFQVATQELWPVKDVSCPPGASLFLFRIVPTKSASRGLVRLDCAIPEGHEGP